MKIEFICLSYLLSLVYTAIKKFCFGFYFVCFIEFVSKFLHSMFQFLFVILIKLNENKYFAHKLLPSKVGLMFNHLLILIIRKSDRLQNKFRVESLPAGRLYLLCTFGVVRKNLNISTQ